MNRKYRQIVRFTIHALRWVVFLLAVLAVDQARAAWPEHTVTLIVPFPAGGPTDLLGRLLAAELAARLRKTVIVQNRAGAVGNIGIAAAARASQTVTH